MIILYLVYIEDSWMSIKEMRHLARLSEHKYLSYDLWLNHILFIYLFIQHLLSALFTNQYALMRCLKHNKL